MSLNNEKNPHYSIWKGKSAVDVIEVMLSREEYSGFLKGNILKYQLRLGKKDNVEKELLKIKDYRSELDSLEKKPCIDHLLPSFYRPLKNRKEIIEELVEAGLRLSTFVYMSDADVLRLHQEKKSL